MFSEIFSRIPNAERRDLLIGWIAISIAFTLIYIRNGVTVDIFLFYLIISLLTAGLAFMLHELAHKFSAMKFGYWAQFEKNSQMLVVAIALAALVGVVFAAPGVTMIYGNGREMTKRENGIISAAGPLTNILLCIPFMLILIAGAYMGGAFVGASLVPMLIFNIGFVGLSINSMIAFFNMLPVSVLDGKKVLAWNPAVFAVLIVLPLLILLFAHNYNNVLINFLTMITGI